MRNKTCRHCGGTGIRKIAPYGPGRYVQTWCECEAGQRAQQSVGSMPAAPNGDQRPDPQNQEAKAS